MNITEAQVPAVTRDGDTFTIPPILACRRHAHLAYTVLYDLIGAGCNWLELRDLREQMEVAHTHWDHIKAFVEQHGRVTITEWLYNEHASSMICHVEPVVYTDIEP